MGLTVDVKSAFTSSAGLLKLRLASQNARHALAKLGIAKLREQGLSAEEVGRRSASSLRGFYSWVTSYGFEAIRQVIDEAERSSSTTVQAMAAEFQNIVRADALFAGFGAVSEHRVLDLNLSVYPGMQTMSEMGRLFPEQAQRAAEVRTLLETNMATPAGQKSPVTLLEDHPGWASEQPDIRNIRGDMKQTVRGADLASIDLGNEVDKLYGAGTMSLVENIVILGIGGNDMYMKALPKVVNADAARLRNLYSVFSPGQLDDLPADITKENTLFLAISRSGGTQETVKCLYFGIKDGLIGQVVAFANKGLVANVVDGVNKLLDGHRTDLPGHIGGRYMLAKGRIVLEPLALTASRQGFYEYTDAMRDFDGAFWPVGSDTTLLDLASHLFMYSGAYNQRGLFCCSNNPILDAGLREIFQLHNEAVGKAHNGMFAFGAGMEMLPFAHAGADGLLGAAISAQDYGIFVFDEKLDPNASRLTSSDVLVAELAHAGLSQDVMAMACVFPNWAKFLYSGGPNALITTQGVSYRTVASLSMLWQNLMYPYLIMNGTNPDSNPNVAMVRGTTNHLITALIVGLAQGRSPREIMTEEIPKVMI